MAGEPHWDERYRTLGTAGVSWYEDRPDVSLDLLAAVGVGPSDSVIDVGGGASDLVGHLLKAGHEDAALDLSSVALEAARSRLGDPSGVTWAHADLLGWDPPRRWAAWHDRAVLHFLVGDADRSRYVEALRRAGEPGGAFVIGVFAEDGPTHCSTLPVRRYSQDDLAALLGDGVDVGDVGDLGDGVDVVARRRQVHHTPSGGEQPFNWVAGRLRTPGGRP